MAYNPERRGVSSFRVGVSLLASSLVVGQALETRSAGVQDIAPATTTTQLGGLATDSVSLEEAEIIRHRRRGSRRAPRYRGPQPWPVIPAHCEQYRAFVQQHPWQADVAMLMIFKESSCDPNAPRGGLVQLLNEHVPDPATNIRRGYEKYQSGRIGENNFSAFYAVCTPGNNPQPKYHNVPCR